MFLPPVEPD